MLLPVDEKRFSEICKTMERQFLALAGSDFCNQVSCSHIPDQFEKHNKFNYIIESVINDLDH